MYDCRGCPLFLAKVVALVVDLPVVFTFETGFIFKFDELFDLLNIPPLELLLFEPHLNFGGPVVVLLLVNLDCFCSSSPTVRNVIDAIIFNF